MIVRTYTVRQAAEYLETQEKLFKDQDISFDKTWAEEKYCYWGIYWKGRSIQLYPR